MASVSSAVKSGSNVADWLLGFIFGYIERFFTVNIPKQFKWMRDRYYPWAKGRVNHPTMYSRLNHKVLPCAKNGMALLMVLLGLVAVVVLWVWVFMRSFRK